MANQGLALVSLDQDLAGLGWPQFLLAKHDQSNIVLGKFWPICGGSETDGLFSFGPGQAWPLGPLQGPITTHYSSHLDGPGALIYAASFVTAFLVYGSS